MKIYDEIFKEYKEYLQDNSIYKPNVVKYNTNQTTYFPTVSLKLSNTTDSDSVTLDFIEKYDNYYFTIDVYTKNISTNNGKVASQVVNSELVNLTHKFFGELLRMKRTGSRPTPNIDMSIDRTTIEYQAMIGNVRKNIIRR